MLKCLVTLYIKCKLTAGACIYFNAFGIVFESSMQISMLIAYHFQVNYINGSVWVIEADSVTVVRILTKEYVIVTNEISLNIIWSTNCIGIDEINTTPAQTLIFATCIMFFKDTIHDTSAWVLMVFSLCINGI